MAKSNYDLSRLVFDEEKHQYRLDGEIVPGVTTILGSWVKVKCGQLDYLVSPHSRQAIDLDVMTLAAEKGTAIHKGASLLLEGEGIDWDSLPDILTAPLRSVEKWLKAMRPKPLAIEFAGYNESILPYAGTGDWMVEMGKDLFLIDIKTGDAPLWSVDAQTKAYEPFIRDLLGIKKKINRAVLYINKAGGPCHIKALDNPLAGKYFEWKLREYYFLKEAA